MPDASMAATESAGESGNPLLELPERHWFTVFLLSNLTLSVYAYIWFISRIRIFNRLKNSSRLNPWLLSGALLMSVVSTGARFMVGIADWTGDFIELQPAMIVLYVILGLVSFLILVHQALRLRRMLKQHTLATSGREVEAGWLLTVLFSAAHMQAVATELRQSGKAS